MEENMKERREGKEGFKSGKEEKRREEKGS